MVCNLVKEVVKKDDKTYTHLILKFDGVGREIQIKPAFDNAKSDYILLCNLAEKK